ncbi:MAG: glycosyltransferase family 2 protein [Bacilli bacterium]|nr:glycosyltransferase family 2 protein [Bacilli bacterium]
MKKVSIIIPCYNEKNTIIQLLKKVKDLSINKEIIVVDDCSTDGSREILKEKGEKIADKVIFHEHNQRKGGALHTGFAAATGDILIPQDADLELDPNDIVKVVEPILENKAEVSMGSRFLNTKMKGYKRNQLANIVLTKFSNMCTKQKITDVNCCYIAFKRKYLQQLALKERDFAINPELIGRISTIGLKIVEVPIQYFPRTSEEGKKVKFRDGFKAIRAIWKYRVK